jgi:hypothetical protein
MIVTIESGNMYGMLEPRMLANFNPGPEDLRQTACGLRDVCMGSKRLLELELDRVVDRAALQG